MKKQVYRESRKTPSFTAGRMSISRVYGGSELPVLDLMRNLEQLLELLQEFDDSRTEN